MRRRQGQSIGSGRTNSFDTALKSEITKWTEVAKSPLLAVP